MKSFFNTRNKRTKRSKRMYRKTTRNNKMKNRKRMRYQTMFWGGNIVDITLANVNTEDTKNVKKYVVYEKTNMNKIFRELTNSAADKDKLMIFLNNPNRYAVYGIM